MTNENNTLSLSPVQRGDWNDFASHVENTGGDMGSAATLLDTYKKINPHSSLAQEHIPIALNEVSKIKLGQPIGDLSPTQASYIHSGLSNNYKDDPANFKYPVSPTHGTDLEGHVGDNPVSNPAIPAPDYKDPASRMKYAERFVSKYGPLMQHRGDTALNVNSVPRGASDTAKNISTHVAGKYGIDPALLYSSAMEEGMSGLFKGPDGKDTKNRKPGDFGYQDNFGDKEFPINGDWSFGVNTFSQQFPDLVKKGYLPAEFASNFRGAKNEGQFNKNNFKTADAALQAKAAILKSNYDEADTYAKKKGIVLSPKARDFFALVNYNGGSGTGKKMMDDYSSAGALAGDKFLQARPTSGKNLKAESYKQVYENSIRRIKMADALKKERLF